MVYTLAMKSLGEALYSFHDRDLALGTSLQYTLRLQDLPIEEKPRERLLKLGPTNITNAELMSIIWGVGTKTEDVLAMARRTMREYGEKALVNEHNPRKLAEATDIPLGKACQVVASFELGRRFYATQGGHPAYVRNAKQAYAYLRDMANNQKEQLRALYLNSRYQVIHDEVISIGSLTSNIVHPREVFQPAIERRAVAVIIAHNHPSGVLEPSTADIEVTEQLVSAGRVLGIDLLDHLVIIPNKYISIMECLDYEQ